MGPFGLGDRDGAVQRDDGGRPAQHERVVQRDHSAPVGVIERWCRDVESVDRGLQLIRPRRSVAVGPAEYCEAPLDLLRVPERSILIAEHDGRPGDICACPAPRVDQQYEREQPGDLGIIGHQFDEQSGEPDGLVAQISPDEAGVRCARMTLGEDRVDHAADGREPIDQRVEIDRLERDPGSTDLGLRPGEAACHRRLRDEERARDLRGRETADHAQRQCDLSVGSNRRVAASEQQRELIVDQLVRAQVGVDPAPSVQFG